MAGMKCKGCDDYDERCERLCAPEVFMQATRPYAMKPYPKEWVFKYCPWCGSLLENALTDKQPPQTARRDDETLAK